MDDFIEVRVITYIKHRNRFIQHIKNFIKSKQIKIKKSKVKHGFSQGENTIWNLLKQHTIKFEFQKRFSDCKDKNTLPFDFFIPKYNALDFYFIVFHNFFFILNSYIRVFYILIDIFR